MVYHVLRIILMLLIIIPLVFGLYCIFIQGSTLFRVLLVTVYTVAIVIVLLSMFVDLIDW